MGYFSDLDLEIRESGLNPLTRVTCKCGEDMSLIGFRSGIGVFVCRNLSCPLSKKETCQELDVLRTS